MTPPQPATLRLQRDINLWRIPLLLSLGAAALFALTMVPDVLDKLGVIHLPWWLTMGSIDDARAILGATMGAVATVLALIFSVALLVLSMVATLFGPRLLYRFLQDWVTQVTIGLFMGTFVYLCLVFLVTHQDATSSFIPQVSLVTGWCLVVGSFGFLVYYSHRIAVSIQNPDLVARIAHDIPPSAARAVTRGPGEGAGVVPDDDDASEVAPGAAVALKASGYLQHVDHAALVTAAQRAQARVIFHFRPGQFVLRGEALASVIPAAAGAALERAVRSAAPVGLHRTLTQDCEFGVAQIVEIAIRALSPAINDTFTGVACVDWLGDALLALAGQGPIDGRWHDRAGALRVRVPAVRLERVVKLAFDQIRQASSDAPAVLVRQLDMIARVAPRLPAASRAELSAQAAAIRTAAASRLAAIDLRDVEASGQRARAALDAQPA